MLRTFWWRRPGSFHPTVRRAADARLAIPHRKEEKIEGRAASVPVQIRRKNNFPLEEEKSWTIWNSDFFGQKNCRSAKMRPISSSLLPLLIPLLLLLLDCPRLSAGWRRSNSARKRLKQKEAALNITIESSGEDEEREGKREFWTNCCFVALFQPRVISLPSVFSLFNVVQFKNSPCASTITASVG